MYTHIIHTTSSMKRKGDTMDNPTRKDLDTQWKKLAEEGQRIGEEILELESKDKDSPRLAELYAQLAINEDQFDAVLEAMREFRIQGYKNNPEKIYKDAKLILSNYTKEEFIDYAKHQNANINYAVSIIYKQLELGEITEEELKEELPKLRPRMQQNFAGAVWYLEGQLEFEREVIARYGLDPTGQRLKDLIEKKASEWYEKPAPLYVPIVNNKATNALAKINTEAFIEDKINHIWESNIDGVRFVLDNNQEANSTQIIKTMDLLLTRLAEVIKLKAPSELLKGTGLFAISLKEYMELCGLSDRTNARAQLTKSLQYLYNTSATWIDTIYYDLDTGEKLKSPESHKFSSRLLISIGDPLQPIESGRAIVELHPNFVQALSAGQIALLPRYMLKINTHKHPHAYRIARFLALYHNMNLEKPNENRISVKAILDKLPGIPSYDEVMATSKKLTQLIITPVERDLNALQDEYKGIKWHYCNSNGDPLTDEQLEDYSYNEWITWLIEFEHLNYPPQEERRKKLQGRRKEKAKKPAKKEN